MANRKPLWARKFSMADLIQDLAEWGYGSGEEVLDWAMTEGGLTLNEASQLRELLNSAPIEGLTKHRRLWTVPGVDMFEITITLLNWESTQSKPLIEYLTHGEDPLSLEQATQLRDLLKKAEQNIAHSTAENI